MKKPLTSTSLPLFHAAWTVDVRPGIRIEWVICQPLLSIQRFLEEGRHTSFGLWTCEG